MAALDRRHALVHAGQYVGGVGDHAHPLTEGGKRARVARHLPDRALDLQQWPGRGRDAPHVGDRASLREARLAARAYAVAILGVSA